MSRVWSRSGASYTQNLSSTKFHVLYFMDEEYDRGKVKKVRNKEKQAGFDANPFQAVANSSKLRLQAEVRGNIDD
jgi:hypothetical protein